MQLMSRDNPIHRYFLQEVAQVVVPPGSTVQGATQYTLVSPARPGGEEITRSYYAYKFVRGPKTSFLVAGAARGKVRYI